MARKPQQAQSETVKRKKVTITPIERTDEGGPECYEILDRLVANLRPDLVEVQIAMAWKQGWTVDRDGLLKAGKCCKPSEVHRSLMEFDLVILINEELWPVLSPWQKEELVFHELMHAVVVLDDTGEPKRDEKERLVLRIRKHDIEEFHVVRERYGQDNLRSIGADLITQSREPLLQPRARRRSDTVDAA